MTDSQPTNRITDAAQLGQQIRRHRKQLGLTQADAAALCGVGNRFLSDLENGKATAHIGKAFAVLNGLGLDMHVAPRGQPSKTPTTVDAPGALASVKLQNYLDQLSRYTPPKLPDLGEQAKRLARQVAEEQAAAGKALQSAAAQIEALQNRLQQAAKLPDDSDG